MKIVCGSCGAKYSIADEKVQGKVFKIRCRKCSNTIVVKGTGDESSLGASSSEASASSSYGGSQGASEWYAVINGEQSSAMTAEELEAYFHAGQIQADTYIWKEGMANWDSLANVPTFTHLVQGSALSGLGYGDVPADPMFGAESSVAEPDEATAIAQSPLSNPSAYNNDPVEEDATAVIDANQWRAQQEAAEAATAAAASSYDAPINDDPTAAFPRPEGGWDESFGSDMTGGNDGGYDQTAQGAFTDSMAAGADPYGSGDFNAGIGDYGSAGQDLVGGGALDYGSGTDLGGISDAASLGSGDGLFNNFDADASGAGGIAYQSFSGIGAAPSDLDLGAAIGSAGSLDAGFGGAPAADYGGGASFDSNGYNGSASQMESPEVGYENQDGLIGTRNENSVLFSLSSLQQVNAVDSGAKDVPLTEGSGLIDIQSLAATHSQFSNGMEDSGLPSGLGVATPSAEPFAPGTMSVPAIMPRGTHRDNKPLIIGLIFAVLVLAGAGIAAAVILSNKDTDEQPTKVIERIVEKQVPSDKSAEIANNKALSELEAIKKQLADQKAAAAAAAKDETTEPEEKEGSKKRTDRRKTKTKRNNVGSSTPPTKKKTRKGSGDEISDLIGKLDKPKPKKETPTTTPVAKSNLPKKLSKPQVQGTIRKYSGRVKSCGKSSNSGGLKGSVMVGLKIRASGSVSSASIKSAKFKSTDVGRCILGVVKGMKFPAAQSPLTISKYPFRI